MSFSLLPMAYAATDSAAAVSPHPSDTMGLILPIVVFVIFIYFLMWRPQSKKIKEQKQLMNNLAVGDEVITVGGILGRISKISDDFIILLIAENVEITVQKASVSVSLPKGTLKTI